MSRRQIRNIPASVRQKLLNISRKDNRPFNELMQYYAIERFLYRLSQSDYADSFILKGALVLQIRKKEKFRPNIYIKPLFNKGIRTKVYSKHLKISIIKYVSITSLNKTVLI